jgi:hypothetical protein
VRGGVIETLWSLFRRFRSCASLRSFSQSLLSLLFLLLSSMNAEKTRERHLLTSPQLPGYAIPLKRTLRAETGTRKLFSGLPDHYSAQWMLIETFQHCSKAKV